jgi:hypothetical protein
VKATVVAATLCVAGLWGCVAEGGSGRQAEALGAGQQALRGQVQLERPMFSVPGISVSVEPPARPVRTTFVPTVGV